MPTRRTKGESYWPMRIMSLPVVPGPSLKRVYARLRPGMTRSLVLVIRLFLIEHAFHRLEVPDVRLLVAVLRRAVEFRDRVVDHVLRQHVQFAPGLHGQDLHLAGALGV